MKKILLADDELALRFLLSETLEDEGYHVVEAEDGQEAKDALEEQKFTGVILDYMMPEHTGLEVCQWLRQSSNSNSQVPVILLTAKAQDKDRAAAKDAGVDQYITKPFSPIQLLEILDKLLKD